MLKYYYIVIQIFETILNLFMVCILNIKYIFRKTHYPNRNFDSIQILGNGPSLKDDIPKILAKRKNSAIMVVNTFATTELFEQLKPEYYVLVDPVFFSPLKNERIKKVQESTLMALIEKTKWNLNLFVPYSATKSILIKEIEKGNDLIKIIFFKNIPVIGGYQKMNNFFFFNNLANPLFMNVLIPAIFFSIKMKFFKILLWGADNSWHENYTLGKDNYIYRTDRHFFDKDFENNLIILSKADGSPQRVHEEFFNMYNVFRVYHSLEAFSKKYKCQIFNLSSKTWIDAFKRILN